MKARIKETGVLIDVTPRININALYNGDNLYVCDNMVFRECELDFLNVGNLVIDWEQRRYELAKAAMQALISNSFFMKNLGMYLDEHPDKKMDAIEVVAIESINYTDVLIKKLKGD